MKTTIALLFALAALASAGLSPNYASNAVNVVTRQECIYNCNCNDDKDPDSELPDPETAPCCSSAGGSLGSGGTLCEAMPLATAQNFARCCGRSGGYTCFQSGKSCPPVNV
ncbi:hypothetical protein B0H67DRAFT_490272 [Lasiosphaeris hirsuta]|uniref:Uncharacterized protein n=1 Tax=Lasiosphaeris hirsuta TaxID=260670 RepID=A0AA40AI99_9PEZI|nr:hypothetical protein B0H67DRAFT_490272 [Lasiosphaeris hirsuta]